jgi:hypothetical protein
MKELEFKSWLEGQYPDSGRTVSNRMSNIRRVMQVYGDLDKLYEKNKCKELLDLLTYSTEDERSRAEPRHNIKIVGNIRNGTATLKQALGLYCSFREQFDSLSNTHDSDEIFWSGDNQTSQDEIYSKLKDVLMRFNFRLIYKEDVVDLQLQLKEYLAQSLTNYCWDTEYRPNESIADRIDIYGQSNVNNVKIAIELDPHRADSVAKKFVSRIALLEANDMIYVSLCYPGTNRMSKNECKKYFNYCQTICNLISNNSKSRKQYIGMIF